MGGLRTIASTAIGLAMFVQVAVGQQGGPGPGHPPSVIGALPANLALVRIDPGDLNIGDHQLLLELANSGENDVPLQVSIRLESPSHNQQTSHYRLIHAGETATWVIAYHTASRAYRLLRVFVGATGAMPTDSLPYPGFDGEYQELRWAVSAPPTVPAPRTASWRHYWDLSEPREQVRELPTAFVSYSDSLEIHRQELRNLLEWAPDPSTAPASHLVGSERLGPYLIRSERIDLGSASIEYLLIRRSELEGPLPTVIYLTGNPPGTKESGRVPAMILADVGLQVASVDRRDSARSTEAGEFLGNIAGPVSDAKALVDHLVTREEVSGHALSVFGFSTGAFEGMFLAALHPRVSAAVLASRLVDHDSLFAVPGWLPTLWDPLVLEDLGLEALIGNWEALYAAISPEVGERSIGAYRKRYSFFDALNPARVLPLVAPKPVLVIAGALDSQFPLGGVTAADRAAQEAYRRADAAELSQLYIMPRGGHALTPQALDRCAEWLRLFSGLAPPSARW